MYPVIDILSVQNIISAMYISSELKYSENWILCLKPRDIILQIWSFGKYISFVGYHVSCKLTVGLLYVVVWYGQDLGSLFPETTMLVT